MDEVENPDLPAAGESSPTIRPVDQDENDDARPTTNSLAGEGRIDSANPSPLTHPAAPQSDVPLRPTLKRESSAPPPQQPPPAPPSELQYLNEFSSSSSSSSSEAPDSLTLAELKRIRSTFPTAPEPIKQKILDHDQVYDFKYQDAQSFPVELEEWFTYSSEEEARLRKCKAIFGQVWRTDEDGGGRAWMNVEVDVRRRFVRREMESLRATKGRSLTSLMILVYLGLGVWDETAGLQGASLEDLFAGGDIPGSRLEEYKKNTLQIQWMVTMVKILHECDGLKVIYDCLRQLVDDSFSSSAPEQTNRNESQPRRSEESMDLWCCLTLMYLFIEVARTTKGPDGKALKRAVLALEPKVINCFTQIIARLRWDEVTPVPLTKMLLLAWKTILVTFGGIIDVEHVKASLRDNEEDQDQRGEPVITASPLDYHLFRQEISSKYPAYVPPVPAFPLEPENNSILPPLKHRQPSFSSTDAAYSGVPSVGTHSIMHQPVHIATPAPSPPPSPAGPGKAGKKQNYQTNQMFPFLYPPLDESSNELGGKGSTSLQDAFVGRKWQGSDVPTSILEAAELFAKRMRATRAMKQLWEARIDFMKFERGWKTDGADDISNEDVDEFELLSKPAPEETADQGEPLSLTEEQKTIAAVGQYYEDSLPHLQSVVIVLLKAVLQSVTDLVTKNNSQNALQAGIRFEEFTGMTNGSAKPLENGMHNIDGIANTAEELDKLRTQEIQSKALSSILLLLLKWFKVSHVLQYEYMTQLLLDSNYIPLILKLWQTQEIGRAIHYPLDREDANFFHLCQRNSRNSVAVTSPQDAGIEEARNESEDEAAPPPIKRTRDTHTSDTAVLPTASEFADHEAALAAAVAATHPPEIDELGYPTTPLPPSPLKQYNWRTLFTSINHLRTLQKITRRKTHRALLLVSYKSSNHLKKSLKVPVHLLRYYTLKLYKTQVPFCGRKWRQGNMKIITAVWLSVPPELRDDWLSGGGGGVGGQGVGDVDGTVEDALPLEQGLRSLTQWWNLRNYSDVMGVDREMLEREEGSWFERELERMGVLSVGEEEGEMGEEEMPTGVEGPGWGGPIDGY
ncbi:hypothetical protein LTR62_007693 [Meristemomyces frigidus]|uniref:Factor arrest protein 11 n=1 Tax=Meristemomyces frigidus TaxID=1508187 RepID=A0AAN7TBC3_9PEZI|nr:hypothetical protein LTR62_007693 [Meristemomyces frigidus]